MPKRDGEERRDRRRHRVSGLSGVLRHTIEARVLDLSVLGMAIETSSWLQVGQRYRLRMVHPDHSVDYDSQVVWCHLVGSQPAGSGDVRPIYQAGLQFVGSPNDEGPALRELLEKTAVVSVGSRLAGRFKVRREKTVDVSLQHEFEVLAVGRQEVILRAELLPEIGTRFRLEIGEGEDQVRATVGVEELSRTPGSRASKLICRILEVDPETRGSLERLIRSQLDEPEAFVANESSRVFHRTTCRHAPGSARIPFHDRSEALAAGFKPGGCCSP